MCLARRQVSPLGSDYSSKNSLLWMRDWTSHLKMSSLLQKYFLFLCDLLMLGLCLSDYLINQAIITGWELNMDRDKNYIFSWLLKKLIGLPKLSIYLKSWEASRKHVSTQKPTHKCLKQLLFIVAKTQKQPRCPSMGKWINKLWFTHTMEYHSAIKRNELSFPKNTRRNLKCI